MKIVELKYKSFAFPLNQKFTNSTQSFKQKEILILRAKNEKGNIAFGEVSPLPGFSKESISDCEERLTDLSFDKMDFSNNYEHLNNEINQLNDIPSLKFGFEQILISLMLYNNSTFFNENNLQNAIKVNGSIGFASLEETKQSVKKILKRGISIIKIKIGRESFDDDLKILNMIKEYFGDKVTLRLDVNGKWEYEEAKTYISQLIKFNIEYIEQPVKDKNDLLALTKKTKINIAPDESIQNINDVKYFINSRLVKFIILKPTIRLGIFDTLKTINLAKEKNIIPIITTALETSIGRNMLILLAGITNHNFTHGLAIDVLGKSPFNKLIDNSTNGKIQVKPNSLNYNYDDLWNFHYD